MSTADQRRTVSALLAGHGRTYAAEAGVRLRDTPQPLYQLLVLAGLLSARIRASIAVAAARALFDAGMRDPRRMAEATWQQRVDALGEGGYRRYDERTATQLGEGAQLLRDTYRGDLRRMRQEADGDLAALRDALRKVPGIGPTGADIFLREAQAVWPEFVPHLDGKALQGAERLGLPSDPRALARLVDRDRTAELAAALVRAALDKEVVEDVRRRVAAD
ncbi:endonuclease [Streptomyces sp. NPDC059740]|uniref:endonuclease n=1 Tax=Streptomyces sp. NPDC059740 TaxID=3346926 RepID=UPI003647960E